MRKKLQYFFPQETQCFYNICACFSNLTVRSFSGVSHAIFFPQEVSVAMRFVHVTVILPRGISVESYMVYYPLSLLL